jgi:rhodanese-related sulfurtransferase
MRAVALVSLTLPSQDPDASRRWWSEQLELAVGEEDADALDLGDVSLRFGSALAVEVVSFDLTQPVQLADPSGTPVLARPPDHEAAARNEESIRSFVERAADLPGRSVEDVADEVAAAVLETQRLVHEAVSDLPNDKRLAVYLELGQRARTAATGRDWHLHAASTLMSGTFGPDA